MNPILEKYLNDKKLAEQDYSDQQERSNTGNLFANIGDAIAGKSIGSSNGYFDGLNKAAKSNIDDAENSKRSAMADMQFKNDQEKYDPNSNSSMSFRKAIEASMPGLSKTYGDQWANVTAADKDLIFEPAKFRESVDARKETARILSNQKELDRKEKSEAKAVKDKELSVAQAKQLGLYKTGILAESQYADAIKDKNDYDPTSVGQLIDNSEWAPNLFKNNNAIKAQAAQSGWVEAYLRDASGAAIPPSERMAYAKDFFPQPGEDASVIANKAALRKQKMENARIGAGAQVEPDVEKYARDHKLSYEQALAIKLRRENSQAGR